MIDLIKEIFTDNELFSTETPTFIDGFGSSGFFAISNSFERKEYYLVIQVESLEKLISKSEEDKGFDDMYSMLLKENYYKPNFNKNISLIILLKTDTPNATDKLKKQIYEVEENPYYFKKYVLQYTTNQFDDLKAKCTPVSVQNLDNLVKGVEFEEFKTNPYSDNYVQLLFNIYIKFSFLKIPVKKKEIDNLTDKIVLKLQSNGSFEKVDEIRSSILNNTENKSIYELFGIPKSVV